MIFKPNNIQIYNKKCIGCINHDKDIMLSFDNEDEIEIHDLFLSTQQAKRIIELLQKRLEENKQL